MNHEPQVQMGMDIERVPADFPVDFCLLTHRDRQYVGYYDFQRRMTVASRTLDSNAWQYHTLPSQVGWDSHNYVTMAIDDNACVHLSGNMHCKKLVYFRTAKPWEIASFEKIDAMTGMDEEKCTYPKFMSGAEGELIFHYRDGSSGNGREIYNVYDLKTGTWRRLLDRPLADGQGQRNPYMCDPLCGPDGYFHVCWVWRDTPDCTTNHDLSYARSRDLIHWGTIDGTPVELPFLIGTKGLIVDPVPVNGGIINGSQRVGFDSKKRVLVSYHKFDGNGKTQAYVARFERGAWVSRQVSDWDYRWAFEGLGAIVSEIVLGAVKRWPDGNLALPYWHVKYGEGHLIIDDEDLHPLGATTDYPERPPRLCTPESEFPGVQVRWADDLGSEYGDRYVLRWETLPANRDRARSGPLPEPGMLRLYQLVPGEEQHGRSQ